MPLFVAVADTGVGTRNQLQPVTGSHQVNFSNIPLAVALFFFKKLILKSNTTARNQNSACCLQQHALIVFGPCALQGCLIPSWVTHLYFCHKYASLLKVCLLFHGNGALYHFNPSYAQSFTVPPQRKLTIPSPASLCFSGEW